MNQDVTFTVSVTMNERWIDAFCSMLKCMEFFGAIGHSDLIGFYADGDGDFHPKFDIDVPFTELEGIHRESLSKGSIPEFIFDAG